ncbi:MAG: TadE family protein, partial [Mucilaginibacter sp.]
MKKQKGAAMLEFVIVLPFLLMLIMGVVEFGNVLMNFNTLNKITMDASRYLSIYAKQGNGTYALSTANLQAAQNLMTCGNKTTCGSYSIL